MYSHLIPCCTKKRETSLLILGSVLFNLQNDNDNLQYLFISKCNRQYCKPLSNNSCSHDDLNYTVSNIMISIESALCGLIYVGETRQRLNLRIIKHYGDDHNNNTCL